MPINYHYQTPISDPQKTEIKKIVENCIHIQGLNRDADIQAFVDVLDPVNFIWTIRVSHPERTILMTNDNQEPAKPEGAPKNISQTGFDDSYSGVPPWDIGHPQKEIVKLSEEGLIKGSVLDAGCGTGEHVLYFTSLGQKSWGIDFSPAAIEKAQLKAAERGLEKIALFHVADALKLENLSRHAHTHGAPVVFDNIIDTGLFHCFNDADRKRYAKSLSEVLAPGGKYFMLCFSEHEPTEWGGPRRVTQKEIRETFKAADGWNVDFIREAVFETNFHPKGGKAWMTKATWKKN